MDVRDPRCSLRRGGSLLDDERIRRRPAIPRPHRSYRPSYSPNPLQIQMERSRKRSLRTAQRNFSGFPKRFDPIENSRRVWESSQSLTEEATNFPTKRRTQRIESKENNLPPSSTDGDEINVRDKYALFEEQTKSMSTLRTPKHRNSSSTQSVSWSFDETENAKQQFFPQQKFQETAEKNEYSFNVILAMFAFRFMSTRQRRLGYDGPEIPNPEFQMKLFKILICYILRWMKDKKLIQFQRKTFPMPLRSNYDSDETTSSGQASFSSLSHSFTYSTDSSTYDDQTSMDLSQYIPPKYVQIFLKNLVEATDTTPDYIHAHNRTDNIMQNDDDGMSGELINLHFIEMEIKKEMKMIDGENVAKFAEEKTNQNSSTDRQYSNNATTTDAFYSAVIAMVGDISDDDDDEDGDDDSNSDISTFDVQNAKETVLQLVNQIQSQLPQKILDKAPQSLPQIKEKIMNDLFVLSQTSQPERSYEILIDLQASLSSIGSFDPAEDHCSVIGIERCYSNGNVVSASDNSSEESGGDLNRDQTNEETSELQKEATQEVMPIKTTPNVSQRSRGTIWRTLLQKRLESGRKSPYLLFNKSESNDEYSVGSENSCDAESKYLSFEYIRESHENNNSIEVILKDNFEISKMDDVLTQATSNTDESTLLSDECSEVKCKKVDMNADVLKRFTSISHVNQTNSAMMNIPFDESFKSEDNDLQDITWSMSPVIDNFSPSQKRTNNLTTRSIESITIGNEKTFRCQTNREEIENRSMSGLPSTPEYWKALLTHSFSSSFDESIESIPIYAVHSESVKANSEPSTNIKKLSVTDNCELKAKEDPSGHYRDSIGDYDDYSLCSIGDIPRDIEATQTSADLGALSEDPCFKCNEYDPIEASRKIPNLFSEPNETLETLESSSHDDDDLGIESAIDKYGQPVPSNVSDSAETIYFDTEDNKLCKSRSSKNETIDLSGSFASAYFSLPSVHYSDE